MPIGGMYMDYVDTQDDREPTESELEKISKLSSEQVAGTDEAILFAASHDYKKVAMIVAMVKACSPESMIHVSTGHLEARGDLKKMRYSEVRLNYVSQCPSKNR